MPNSLSNIENMPGSNANSNNHSSSGTYHPDNVSNNESSLPQPIKDLVTGLLKVSLSPLFASMSSLSLAIFIILAKKSLTDSSNETLAEKIALPLVPYGSLVCLRTWLLYNGIGHRLNGQADEIILVDNQTLTDEPSRVLMALAANISSFTNALLVGFLVLPTDKPVLSWSLAILLAGLNYSVEGFTRVVDAFRKHAEYRNMQGKPINAFFKQKYIRNIPPQNIRGFAILLRELYPIITSLIRSKITIETSAHFLEGVVPQSIVPPINIFLGLGTYWGTAYFTRFELSQLKDSLKTLNQEEFFIENALSQSTLPPLKTIGKLSSGEFFMDALKKLKVNNKTRLRITFLFSVIGMFSILQQVLHTYISSPDVAAVNNEKEGLILSYFFGKTKAVSLAPQVEVAIYSSAFILAFIATFIKSATVYQLDNLHQGHLPQNTIAPIVADLNEPPIDEDIENISTNRVVNF